MQKYKSRDDCETYREFMQQFKSVQEYHIYEMQVEWEYQRKEDEKNMILLMKPLKENNFGKWRYAKINLDDYLIAVSITDDGQYEVIIDEYPPPCREGMSISLYSPMFCNLANGRLLKSNDFNQMQTAFIKNKILTEIFKINDWDYYPDLEKNTPDGN